MKQGLRVTIYGKDMAEIRTGLNNALAAMGEPQSNTTLPTENLPEAASTGKKRGRRSKAEIEAANAAEAAPTETEEREETSAIDISSLKDEPAAAVTFDEIRAALKSVVSQGDRGVDAAAEILQTFKCERVSQVKEADYSAFKALCEKALLKLN